MRALSTRLLALPPRSVDLSDARWFQLAGQASILAIGLILREFGIALHEIAAIFAAALGTQWVGSTLFAARFEWKSAAITALSLSLLLRADSVGPLMLAAVVGIGGKFLLRWRGRHLFNPANLAIVTMLTTGGAWTSTSEWGSTFWFALFIAAFGTLITRRAGRFDVPVIFLAVYATLLFGRALYLGDPIGIPLLRLQNGELILFAFFMLTDPRTTPDDPAMRAVFVVATAILAYVLQFHYFNSDGFFYAAFALACVRPLLELVRTGAPHRWGRRDAQAPAE